VDDACDCIGANVGVDEDRWFVNAGDLHGDKDDFEEGEDDEDDVGPGLFSFCVCVDDPYDVDGDEEEVVEKEGGATLDAALVENGYNEEGRDDGLEGKAGGGVVVFGGRGAFCVGLEGDPDDEADVCKEGVERQADHGGFGVKVEMALV